MIWKLKLREGLVQRGPFLQTGIVKRVNKERKRAFRGGSFGVWNELGKKIELPRVSSELDNEQIIGNAAFSRHA